MSNWKKLLFYLLINILISATTTWIILTIWGRIYLPASTTKANNSPNPSVVPTSSDSMSVVATSEASSVIQPSKTEQLVEEYIVRADDTLGKIAADYEVSVEKLLKFNGLKDPNSLSVGMVIYIPIEPEIIPTDEPTATRETSLVSGTPGATEQGGSVVINSVIGVGDLESERVFLSRTGKGVLMISGWRIMDEDGNVFEFPNLELYEGGAVNLWTKSGTQTVVDLYWGLQTTIWESGETVALVDADGKLQASYKIP
jgi:LysM repeat protein